MKEGFDLTFAELLGYDAIASINSQIKKYHKHLEHVPLVFFFFETEKSKGGRQIMGTASILTETERAWCKEKLLASDGEALGWGFGTYSHLADGAPGFAIKIHRPSWSMLDEPQQAALVDHELCHCIVEWDEDQAMKLSIVAHDIEEFNAVVERHGDWKGEVERLQKSLFGNMGSDLSQERAKVFGE